jgi:hypothetical protein
MTPPIPVNGARQRPSKSCLSCRAAKAKCVGLDEFTLHQLEEAPGTSPGQRCNRCTRLDVECTFVASRRRGRPRRLSPKNSDAEPTHHLPPSPSASPPSSAASPPQAARSLDYDWLARSYLSQIHPYAPLLPPSLADLNAYLGQASSRLTSTLHYLLSPSGSTPPRAEPFGAGFDELQAAVFSVFGAYGRGDKGAARETLKWACERVIQMGWRGDLTQEMDGSEGLITLGWTCWGLEIMLAVLTGVRTRVLDRVTPSTLVSSTCSRVSRA